jgi:hypothetical protein
MGNGPSLVGYMVCQWQRNERVDNRGTNAQTLAPSKDTFPAWCCDIRLNPAWDTIGDNNGTDHCCMFHGIVTRQNPQELAFVVTAVCSRPNPPWWRMPTTRPCRAFGTHCRQRNTHSVPPTRPILLVDCQRPRLLNRWARAISFQSLSSVQWEPATVAAWQW